MDADRHGGRLLKKALKIFWGIIVAIASLLFAGWILLQTPAVQTHVSRMVAESLGSVLDGRIEFSKIHIRPFSAIVIKDIVLLDNSPAKDWQGERLDTVAHAKSIVATLSLKELRNNGTLHVRRLTVKDGSFVLAKDGRGNNIGRLIRKPDGKKESKTAGFRLKADKVRVSGFRFRLVNMNSTAPLREHGIDWKNLDVTAVNLHLHDLTYADGRIHGFLDMLTADERSGYRIVGMSGEATAYKGRTTVRNLHIADSWSDISMDEYSMDYQGKSSFSNFTDEVVLTGMINDSRIDFKSLSYFAPSLRKMNVIVNLNSAAVKGPVKDLTVNHFDFSDSASGVHGMIDGVLSGLPSAKRLRMNLSLRNFGLTAEGLGTFIRGLAPNAVVDMSRFAGETRFVLNGSAKGGLNSLDATVELDSPLGGMAAEAQLTDILSAGKSIGIGGRVSTKNLNVGRLSGIRQIGEVTLHGGMKATLGGGKTNLRIDSLSIDRMSALGYSYSGIAAAGTYSDNAFDGRIVCSDPNLNFLFQGLFTLSDKTRNGLYKFYASIGYADLHALRLDKRENSKISGRINANYINISRGDLIGDLDILGLTLENDNGWHEIGDICVKSHSNNNVNRIDITSSFLNGSFIGTRPLTALVKDFQWLTVQRELPSIYKEKLPEWKGDEYDLALDVSDAKDILSFLKPGLYIAKGSKVRVGVTKDGNATATIESPRIAIGKNFLKDINLTFDNKDSSLNVSLACSSVRLSGLNIQKDNLILYAKEDSFGAGFAYDNGTEPTNKGEIYIKGELGRGPGGVLTVNAATLPSYIWYDDAAWNVSESAIQMCGKDIRIDNLTANSLDQSIRVNGGYSSTKKDTLSVNLVKFDMNLLNKLLTKDFGICGLATGHAIISSPWETNPGLMMNLTCDSTEIAGQRVGTLRLASTVDDEKMRLIAKNSIDGEKTFDFNGAYSLKDKRIGATAGFMGFNVGYLKPVLESVFSEMEGAMSGTIKVQGTLDSPSLSSEGTGFDDVLLKVGFTNVPYYVSGPFSISDKGLSFDGLSVKDRFGGSGAVSGGLLFNHLKDFRMDTRIKMSGIEAIDMTEDDNQAFYGHLFASGDLSIKGPFEALRLAADIRTDKDGQIHIPIDNTSSDGKNDLLTFKQSFIEVNEDPYEVMMNEIAATRERSSDFGIKLRVNADQGTEAHVEIDRSAGNVLNGRGQGTIDIEVRPGRDLFTINGDYAIRSGNFHFNAMDIAKRDFAISEGSSVRFNGDVMDSDLDIKGIYSTKASVATLISDTTAVSTRRTVNCMIGVSGKIREPKLSFSIEVPDLDPTTKSRVESALNTEDKVQRQFISLLISGNFMPDEQSGVVNNTNMIYSNVAEIMAGQLNNILQKLDIPLDLGLNYQSSESGTNIFDVAVSTQLFNNRVIVNGNVGNREYTNSSTSDGGMVGNLDIEIKLDKSGQLRLNLFSHSADDYTTYLDNTQRNGAGIAYQREFNTFKEFFRNLFAGKKKRLQRAAAYESGHREVRSLTIQNDSRDCGSPKKTDKKTKIKTKEYDN